MKQISVTLGSGSMHIKQKKTLLRAAAFINQRPNQSVNWNKHLIFENVQNVSYCFKKDVKKFQVDWRLTIFPSFRLFVLFSYLSVCLFIGNMEVHILAKKNSFTPGVNFINLLRTAFTHADPKSVKRYWWLNCIFYAFGIYYHKSFA